jgi:hypothetical protein
MYLSMVNLVWLLYVCTHILPRKFNVQCMPYITYIMCIPHYTHYVHTLHYIHYIHTVYYTHHIRIHTWQTPCSRHSALWTHLPFARCSHICIMIQAHNARTRVHDRGQRGELPAHGQQRDPRVALCDALSPQTLARVWCVWVCVCTHTHTHIDVYSPHQASSRVVHASMYACICMPAAAKTCHVYQLGLCVHVGMLDCMQCMHDCGDAAVRVGGRRKRDPFL